jgi:hypothetical protein
MSSSILLSLPPEIQHSIGDHLEVLDLQVLRMVNHHFRDMFPAATHAELLQVETHRKFLTCLACTRLRPAKAFTIEMIAYSRAPGQQEAHIRFCKDCGPPRCRDESMGAYGRWWEAHGVTYVRCASCYTIREGPGDKKVRVCLVCREENTAGEPGAKHENGVMGRNGVLFVQCLRCGETRKKDGERSRGLCQLCYEDDCETEYRRELERATKAAVV